MIQLKLYPTYQIFLTAVLSLGITAVLTPFWIKLVSLRGIGQVVRTDGPQVHLQKQGTPTMGGLLIVFTVLFSFVMMSEATDLATLAILTTLACGLVGFIDDYSKVVKERSVGLKARAKLLAGLILAALLGVAVTNYTHLSANVSIPLTGIVIPMGKASFVFALGSVRLVVPWLYILFLFLIIASTTNSVNLTDGLDGLAAGTVTIVMLAYAGIAFKQNHLDLALFCAAVGGACVGFLWYNSYPADIFMGDAGSFALGGAVAAAAVFTKTELLLILIGGIYVIETASVILQVISFRGFGKRIFKMAPLHHHFELKGWSETKVMIRFWIVCGVLAGGGFGLYFISATFK